MANGQISPGFFWAQDISRWSGAAWAKEFYLYAFSINIPDGKRASWSYKLASPTLW